MNKWKRWLKVGVSACVLTLGLGLGSHNVAGAQASTPVGGGLYVGDKPLLGVGKEAWEVSGIVKFPEGALLTWGVHDPLTKNKPYLKKSTDAGANWQDLSIPGGGSSIYKIWLEGNRLYAWGDMGLLRSQDQGSTWKSVWKGRGQPKSIDTQEAKVAVVTTDGLLVSSDEGQSFTKIESPEGTRQVAFDADGTLFVQTGNQVYDLHAGQWKRVEGSFLTKTGGHVITYDFKGLYMWDKDHTVTYEYPTAKRLAERIFLIGDRMYLLSENKLYARSLDPNEPWSKSNLPNQGFLMGLAPAPGGRSTTTYVIEAPPEALAIGGASYVLCVCPCGQR